MKKLRTSGYGSIDSRVLLILEEHDLEDYVKEEVVDPKGDEDEAKHKKNMVKA